jgi:hypothetical protein
MADLSSMRALGLQLPSPAYVFGVILFGLAGLAAWRYGRLRERRITQWIGVVLMLYPYLVSQTWVMYVVGIALCAGVLFDRG